MGCGPFTFRTRLGSPHARRTPHAGRQYVRRTQRNRRGRVIEGRTSLKQCLALDARYTEQVSPKRATICGLLENMVGRPAALLRVKKRGTALCVAGTTLTCSATASSPPPSPFPLPPLALATPNNRLIPGRAPQHIRRARPPEPPEHRQRQPERAAQRARVEPGGPARQPGQVGLAGRRGLAGPAAVQRGHDCRHPELGRSV